VKRMGPSYVQVFVTTACDRLCPDCVQQMPRKAPGVHAAWASFEHAAKFIARYPITVTGGEATMHPKFHRIAREFRRMFRADYLELATNGYGVIEHGDDIKCFDFVRITDYPSPRTLAALVWLRRNLPAKHLQVMRPEHIPITRIGGGFPCGREAQVAYYDGKLYPCCIAPAFPGADCIELSSDWAKRIVEVPLPCDRCVFSVEVP